MGESWPFGIHGSVRNISPVHQPRWSIQFMKMGANGKQWVHELVTWFYGESIFGENAERVVGSEIYDVTYFSLFPEYVPTPFVNTLPKWDELPRLRSDHFHPFLGMGSRKWYYRFVAEHILECTGMCDEWSNKMYSEKRIGKFGCKISDCLRRAHTNR